MLFSRKDLVKIIVPLILQQALAVTIGMVDSMMVASAGETAVSGVSLVNSLDLLLVYMFSALTTGGAVVISQALGRGNKESACDAAKQLLYAAGAVATVITTVVVIFRWPLLGALFGDAEAAVLDNAEDYFFYVALSFPFLAINDGVAATFRAIGNSMISLKVSILINLLNVAGNAVLIYEFEMGAAGAAIATLISRVVGAGIMLVLIHNKNHPVHITRLLRYKPDLQTIKSILKIGVPSGVENSMFQFGKLLTQSLISSLGTVSIAANAVAGAMASLQYVPGNAINGASVAIIGRCIGAGEKNQAKRYARILLGVAYGALFTVVAIMSLIARSIIGLYGVSPEASELARNMILYHGLCAVFVWPIAFCLPNVFRAASDVKFTLVVSVISMWTLRVAFGYVLALETVSVFGLFSFPGFGLGAIGVWIAMTLDWGLRATLFLIRFLSGKWLSKYKFAEAK